MRRAHPDDEGPERRLMMLFEALLAHFGRQHWWPAETPWEVAVGAVLTQNTNWQNAEKAISRLAAAGLLNAPRVCAATPDELARHIFSAGYYNVKAVRLQHLARWWIAHADDAHRQRTDPEPLRASLLQVHGVGAETADSILLYAFDIPTFVVDAYTRRICRRHGLAAATATYGQLKQIFETALPRDPALFNEFHALIVAAGKHFCAPRARCGGCPLAADPHDGNR